tara:strand:+ start:303 stop:533 length:231 start_codon:yes stop_codon:yes gene_type:complete
MPISKDEILTKLNKFFPNSKVIVEDLKGDGDHYSATIVSDKFKGKSRIEQHKMVYEALEGKMGSELHALMLKTSSE